MEAASIPGAVEPFTVEHFHAWRDRCELTLDNGDDWVLDEFQDALLADILSPVREAWVILPEGNAKTTLMAGAALYCGDHTPSPWIPIGAASRDQAEIMFGQAGGFVERSKELKKRFRVFEGYRKIKCLRTGGRGIKVYASDTKTGDGVIPTHAFVDELHRHDDLRLYRLWKGKLGKRNGCIRAISTAGEPGSEFEEMRETIRNKALERERVGCHLRAEGRGIVYHEWMVPSLDKARDLDVVKSANPLSTITLDYLDEKLNSDTLDFGEDWLRLTCNIPSRSSEAAIPEADWDNLQVAEQIPVGMPVALGIDFAWQIDTTALVPLWVRDHEFRLFGSPEVLTPPRDGTMLPVDEVKAAFERINDRNPVTLVVADVTKAQDVVQWIEDQGVTVVDRGQGNPLQALDYERWMEAMRQGWLHHTGHPDLRRHVLNAIARRLPGGDTRFDRPSQSRSVAGKRQQRRVIDALTAAAMVHSTVIAGFGAGPPPDPVFAFA